MKHTLIGLTHLFHFDDYLIRENCSLFNTFNDLYEKVRVHSLVSFCNTGKFTDEKDN